MNIEKNKESTVQKDLKNLLEKGVFEGVFPCAAAGILSGTGTEKKKIIIYAGNSSIYPEKKKLNRNDFFDLASLTKPFATTMAILCLLKEKKIGLNEKLPSLLEKKTSKLFQERKKTYTQTFYKSSNPTQLQVNKKEALAKISEDVAEDLYINLLQNVLKKE